MNWSDYENFSESEFECLCGCGKADMKPEFMSWLQQIRVMLGVAMTISSGYRCPDHNSMVSSTGRHGPHTTGMACDVLVSGHKTHNLLKLAYEFGVQGVGIKQTGPHSSRFIHLDMCEEHRPMVWSY